MSYVKIKTSIQLGYNNLDSWAIGKVRNNLNWNWYYMSRKIESQLSGEIRGYDSPINLCLTWKGKGLNNSYEKPLSITVIR